MLFAGRGQSGHHRCNSQKALTPVNVLVAEDDVTSALVFARTLTRRGHSVLLAEDGVEALKALEKQQFDALITDWMMPRMDGLELVERVRADFPQAPVMMVVTAYNSDDLRSRAIDAGADDYLPKPCTPRDLLEHLGLCFTRRADLIRPEPELVRPEPHVAAELPRSPREPNPERDSLYQEFQPLVKRLIRQYGSDAETRKDLEGEIYYIFSSLLDAYDPTRGIPLKPYLVRNLTTSVYTLVRSQWRRQRREVSLEAENGTMEMPGSSLDPSAEWDQGLLNEQVLEVLPRIIAHLPPRQREVVVGRYYEARSFEDIAERMGVQPATVRSLLRHGLNALRNHIAQSGLADSSAKGPPLRPSRLPRIDLPGSSAPPR